jgi:signal transduction histidine kinase
LLQTLEVVYEDRPDLVILDLVMPDMDGLTVCQRLKQDAKLGYLPVIVVTDDHEKRKRLEVRLSGADDYLPKPANAQDLFLRVLALLRIKRQIEQLMVENQSLNVGLQERNEALQKTLAELQEAMRIATQAEMLKKHIIESVDHELRTPMLQIKSAVSMLVEVVNELSADEKNRIITSMVTQAVGRMEELIHNISQLHLIEHLKPATMLLNDAMTQSIHTLRRSWSHRHDVERVHYEIKDIPPVIADRRAISRILFLLLDNALKFSPEDSEVWIKTHVGPNNTVCVAVEDKGIGIPTEYREKIFEPFFQVETGTTKKYGGVGVGLASAQTLARSMNTEIVVESAPNKGSTFKFELPVADLKDY